jgi:hypothetical protein
MVSFLLAASLLKVSVACRERAFFAAAILISNILYFYLFFASGTNQKTFVLSFLPPLLFRFEAKSHQPPPFPSLPLLL